MENGLTSCQEKNKKKMRAVEQASTRYPCPPLGRKRSAAQALLRLLADVKGEGAYSNDFVAHLPTQIGRASCRERV